MLNHVDIAGRLTKNVELRYTKTEVPVASFTIACDRDFKDDSGQYPVDFLDVVAFRQTAKFVDGYFSKGDAIIVSGRLQVRKWTDKEGNKRRTAEIIAENCYFGGSKSDSKPKPAGKGIDVPEPSGRFSEIDGCDGDLPF